MPIDTALLETATTKLITLGVSLAEHIHDRAIAGPDADLPEASKAFDRVTRGTRRAILLARKLAEPPRRVAVRKRIIREVEDNIQRHTDDGDADTLQAELLDRLDTLDLEDDIENQPVEAIIRDILRDFGLAHMPGTHPWKRRTPEDVAELNARARHPVMAGAAHPDMTSAAPPVMTSAAHSVMTGLDPVIHAAPPGIRPQNAPHACRMNGPAHQAASAPDTG